MARCCSTRTRERQGVISTKLPRARAPIHFRTLSFSAVSGSMLLPSCRLFLLMRRLSAAMSPRFRLRIGIRGSVDAVSQCCIHSLLLPRQEGEREAHHVIPPAASKLRRTRAHILKPHTLVERDDRLMREQRNAIRDLAVLDALDVRLEQDLAEPFALVL